MTFVNVKCKIIVSRRNLGAGVKGLGSIRAIFGLIFKIIRIMSHDTKELSSLKNENNF